MKKFLSSKNVISLSFITLIVFGIFIILPIWVIYIFEKVLLFKYLGLQLVTSDKLVQGFIGSLIVGWLALYLQEWWLSRHPVTIEKKALLTTMLRIIFTYPFFVLYTELIWYQLAWTWNWTLLLAVALVITIGWYLSRFPEFFIKHHNVNQSKS